MILYKVISKNITNLGNPSNGYTQQTVFIVRYDSNEPENYVPSQLSSFIYSCYGNQSYNTQLQAARIICSLLNYLIYEHSNENEDRSKGLCSLNLQEFANYINYLTYIKVNAYKTVKRKESVVTRFYAYLEDHNIIKKGTIKRELVYNEHSSLGKTIYVSPFINQNTYIVHYPDKNANKRDILKDMSEDLFLLFIEYAELYYPQIALGVELECCGGIRGAELVNLSVKDISVFKNKRYMKADIKDRPGLFHDRNVNLQNSQVKRPRSNQVIFDFNGKLFDIWENHLRWLETHSKDKRKSLFVNADGLAMTGDSYSDIFNSMKSHFIEYLQNNGHYQLAESLETKSWSTHIGRHIFTNYLLKSGAINDSFGKPNAEYLAILRGDHSISSAKTYIDQTVLMDMISKKLEMLSQMAMLD